MTTKMQLNDAYWAYLESVNGHLLYKVRDHQSNQQWLLWVASPTQLTLQASTPGGATQKVKTRNLPNTLRNDITFRLHNEGALQDVGGQFWERISSENDELVQATDALHSLSRQYDQETLRFLVKVLEQEEIIGDSEILESLRQLKKASRAKARKRA